MSFSVRNPNSFNFSDLTANLKYLQPDAVGAGANSTQGASIVLNASGSPLQSLTNQAFYVAPVRANTASSVLFYNTSSKEVSYGPGSAALPQGVAYSEYLFWNNNTNSWNVGGGSADNNKLHLAALAGQNSQQLGAVALGYQSGQNSQGSFAVALGWAAGIQQQGQDGVAIGRFAGMTNQNFDSVAIGLSAAGWTQGLQSVAIGREAALFSQKDQAVAIGAFAGSNIQSTHGVAVGFNAGRQNQGTLATAVGAFSGMTFQRDFATAIGSGAGQFGQGTGAVALGQSAGYTNQGAFAVAIGLQAGYTNQSANSIVINATGLPLDAATSGLFVKPIASVAGSANLIYNTGTGEINVISSSARYKENITDLQKDTSKILEVKSKEFDLKSNGKHYLGFVAEEVFAIDPHFATLNSDNQPESIDWFNMFVYLLEEVKKLKARLDALEKPAEAPAQ
jgi:hypothetical protein